MKGAKNIIKRFDVLDAQTRAQFKTHWKEISQYFIPNYDDIYKSQVPGEKKGQALIYDTTAGEALKLLSSGLHTHLTNPSLPFFGLTSGDDLIDNDESCRDWLQKAANAMHSVLNGSNFQTEIHEVYMGLGSFGTSSCYMADDPKTVIRFQTYPIYYCAIDENTSGKIDTVIREYKWELRKIIKQFGEKSLPENWYNSRKTAEKLEEKYSLLHAVYPREDIEIQENGEPLPGPKNMPFASVYVLKDCNHILKESGFNEFPYIIPRWMKLPGEKYGRSPAMDSLPDAKMINIMSKTTIEAAQLAIRPPLQRDDDGINQIIDFTPGGVSLRRPGAKGVEPIATGADPRLGEEVMQPVRERIKRHFFLNQLQLAEDNPQMTATEVLQRTDEKLRMLAPILSRQHSEILDPLVDRLFGIMMRKGLLPPNLPDKLKGRRLMVQYTSMIARAQKSVTAELVTRWLGIMGPIIQLKPDTLDVINTDNTGIEVANIIGLPQTMMRGKANMESMRQGRLAQAQKQEQLQNAEAAANVAQKTGQLA